MTVYINSFIPLAFNKAGRIAAKTYNLPLYIDGSCRREPDFQNERPAITQLCRPQKLVPRLKIHDLVIYITKKGRYGTKQAHWKFICILEVIDIQPDHNTAMTFYITNKFPVSQNIMCPLTTPYPLDMTHGLCGFSHSGLTPPTIILIWNRLYQSRANIYRQVAISRIWNNQIYLNNPIVIDHASMKRIFERIPGTQNPPSLTDIEWDNFKKEMNI